MIVPEFLRFYPGYTNTGVMREFTKTFFSLANAMFRIKADEQISKINEIAIGMSDNKDRSNAVEKLKKQSKGKHGMILETRTIKGIKHG